MKNYTKTLLATLVVALLAGAAFAPHAQAVPITGAITFAGGVQLNSSSAGTATGVTSWLTEAGVMPSVASTSGVFNSVAIGTIASFPNAWNFNFVGNLLLWQVGGFQFNLTSSSVTLQGGGGVIVNGIGILSGNGFDATPGIWRFTSQDPSAGTPPTFSFSASTEAVPEGGATVALLGLGLAGVAGLRHKLRRAVG
ncbi:MAG: VPDSG-CTERM sorting domain-containing protein [Chthoniobacterales bacterium]